MWFRRIGWGGVHATPSFNTDANLEKAIRAGGRAVGDSDVSRAREWNDGS
jgi:hypothetical protein